MDAGLIGAEFRHVTFVPERTKLRYAPAAVDGGRPQSDAPAIRPPAERSRLGRVDCVDPFLIWLLERAGLNAADYRPAPLERRLPACLRALHVRRTDEARALLERKPELMPAALGAILIGVTSFFRDADVFVLLERQVLPQLLLAKRSLTCWSAGCSDGAELYSLAIVLAKLGALGGCVLHGTDCRPGAVAKARAGQYGPNEAAAFSPEIRETYFVACGQGLAVLHLLRQAATWSVGDVLEPRKGVGWDLIFCRNLAIYLQPSAAARLWANLHASLRPGGVLVVGKAEHPPDRHRWKRVAGSVFQKVTAENSERGMNFRGPGGQESRGLETIAAACRPWSL